MSIYGIARSLAARELGPAQLLPAIDDVRARSREACPAIERLLDELAARAAPTAMAAVARELGTEVKRIVGGMNVLLERSGKLAARERLELERNIDRVGSELQAAHRLVGVAHAAVAPRPIQLSVADLMRGRWGPQAIFVSRTVEVSAAVEHQQRFDADPIVAWAVLEQTIELVAGASGAVFVDARSRTSHEPTAVDIRLSPDLPRDSQVALVRTELELVPPLPISARLLDALVEHVGWTRERRGPSVHVAIPTPPMLRATRGLATASG